MPVLFLPDKRAGRALFPDRAGQRVQRAEGAEGAQRAEGAEGAAGTGQRAGQSTPGRLGFRVMTFKRTSAGPSKNAFRYDCGVVHWSVGCEGLKRRSTHSGWGRPMP